MRLTVHVIGLVRSQLPIPFDNEQNFRKHTGFIQNDIICLFIYEEHYSLELSRGFFPKSFPTLRAIIYAKHSYLL